MVSTSKVLQIVRIALDWVGERQSLIEINFHARIDARLDLSTSIFFLASGLWFEIFFPQCLCRW
jgi:hypothetical protein